MTRILNIQTNFTVGEVDPLLRGRIDLNQYYSALKTAENVVVIPQGGVRRRPGLKFIYDLPASAANGVSLVPFEFSVAVISRTMRFQLQQVAHRLHLQHQLLLDLLN